MKGFKVMVFEPKCEKVDQHPHPEFQNQETRISEFMRLYAKGSINSVPQNTRPEVVDDRDVDDMLSDGFEPQLSTESIEVMAEIDRNIERFQEAISNIKNGTRRYNSFKRALSIYRDPSASPSEKNKAYQLLDSLTRARD